jgi:uncharacterized protein with GYD domain
MPKYVAFAKYAPEALQGIRDVGYASRQPVLEKMCESLGGRLEGIYFVSSPRWHLMTIQELPDTDAVFALISFVGATSAIADAEIIELRSPAEADAAMARRLSWTPPGQT